MPDSREGQRYYIGFEPVSESGVKVGENPLTDEYLKNMTELQAAQFLNDVSGCCGTPWFLLSPEDEIKMKQSKEANKRKRSERYAQTAALTKEVVSPQTQILPQRVGSLRTRVSGKKFAPRSSKDKQK